MKILISQLLALVSIACHAQQPVHWQYQASKKDASTYEVHFTAIMDPGWHIYSQDQPKTSIAVPTTIKFSKNPLLTVSSKPLEIGDKKKYKNEQLDIEAFQYENKVDFVQEVKIKSGVKTNVSGFITFQVCTEEKCLPPANVPFSIGLVN